MMVARMCLIVTLCIHCLSCFHWTKLSVVVDKTYSISYLLVGF